MFRVGLTGGIASGKTLVGELFAELGAGVVDTDEVAREVVAPGEPGLDAVVAEFGPEILRADGTLDRRALRHIVFRDAQRRGRLEAILHPLIHDRMLQRVGTIEAPYAIVIVPLLLETGFVELVERIAVVDCPESVQLGRLQQRDGMSERDARAMLEAQTDRQTRLASADDVIDNSGTREQTAAGVASLHARYLQMAAAEAR